MTNPGKEQVEVAVEALYTDARTWADMADDLTAMRQVAEGLTLSPFHFSGLACLIGLDSLYGELQQRMVSLLREGSTNFEGIGKALRVSADNYARDEEEGLHLMNNIY